MSYNIAKYFSETPKFLNLLKIKKEKFWLTRGESQARELFVNTYKAVPAYREFLKKHKGALNKIKNFSDFKKIPPTDKGEYLKKFKYQKLFPKGDFPKGDWVISATSGSTGEPFYFPRSKSQDLYYALTAELYLMTNFQINKKKTLYINGFAMGVWIGGLFTYQALRAVAEKGKYDFSIVSPGVNKEEMLKALKKMSPYYDQVILGGYPPFIKDFLDFASEDGFDFSKTVVKFVFSAEGFSEEFRDYIAEKAKLKNIFRDTLNHYGTVDLGTMAYETPIAVLVRRIALKNQKFFDALFGAGSRLPTFGQYIPEHFYFEEEGGGLICSAQSGIPLVRYDLKDLGGVKTFREVFSIAKRLGIDLYKEARKAKISDTIWQLPFVYVLERADFSVSLYGANIYPETIRAVLFEKKFSQVLSGRFSMQVEYSKEQNPKFIVHIEEKKRVLMNKKIKGELERSIMRRLLAENAEYRNNFKYMGEKVRPNVVFWPYEHEKYFKRAGKQKWVQK